MKLGHNQKKWVVKARRHFHRVSHQTLHKDRNFRENVEISKLAKVPLLARI